MKNIKLQTQRLILREWHVDDVDDLVEGSNNIEVSKWLSEGHEVICLGDSIIAPLLFHVFHPLPPGIFALFLSGCLLPGRDHL